MYENLIFLYYYYYCTVSNFLLMLFSLPYITLLSEKLFHTHPNTPFVCPLLLDLMSKGGPKYLDDIAMRFTKIP